MQVTVANCLRCKHEWVVRQAKRPQQCPNCGARKWDVPNNNTEPAT